MVFYKKKKKKKTFFPRECSSKFTGVQVENNNRKAFIILLNLQNTVRPDSNQQRLHSRLQDHDSY